ncbi:type I DNA topoisomerase [Leptotrichia sp. OH3620_COT-345]|uniref:type I DNA topoisomerase n=1 Tax=Leptotrichia sp. OH3620_COT-345 TaxID=2491048 RepID=UPI000F646ACA|nr:type I DNA topoisomerase [Leptotrichia sp. OH3620_COT-345]RRD39044.1 type I DNA topoisomerase [Leptotrichia sp. OH3620_COT-345]
MAKKLVIVESPSKAKTIEKILGKGYEVTASYGHVIDLPKTKIGIDVENNFEPKYQVIKGKGEVLKKLKEKSKKASTVYLASDQDREGEAIAWHISNYIKQPEKTKRIEFNEITKTAVNNAIKNPRDINKNLVNAQQARRLLDRIVGYKISPLLWKTINKNASAGRVQSVALKLICDLEDEIKGFVPQKYWEVNVLLENGISLNLLEISGEKVDKIFDEKVVKKLEKELNEKFLTLESIEIKKKTQRPPLVFKTSTLQQLASSYLGYGATKTMRIAQQLYEGLSINGENRGLITYMRTDSTRVSMDALNMAKEYITKKFGKEYVGYYVTKNSKSNVQDAHEGIRPSDINLDPEEIKDFLSNDQYKLYKLIWNRFLVSQFAAMKYEQMQINAVNGDYKFRGTINKVIFDGYYKIFKEEDEIKTADFPDLKEGDSYLIEKLNIEEGITKPPTRYSEATLVKKLESEGIGRPSTYASIVETLKTREYVEIIEKRFHPTFLGYEVKNELEKNFEDIMNVKFTAIMEEDLDKIEEGDVQWVELLKKFYNSLEIHLEQYEKEIERLKERRIESDIPCSGGKELMVLKTGRFGKYLVCESNPEEKITLKGIAINPEEIEAGKIFIKAEVEKLQADKKGLLTDFFTEENKRYLLKKGRFGEYLESEDYENDQKRMSLPLSVKQKYKKGTLSEKNGILEINEEITGILNEERKIIEEAGTCEKCGRSFEIKIGRFGKFLACTGYPDCKNIKAIPKSKTASSKRKITKKTVTEKKTVAKSVRVKKSKKEAVEKKSSAKKTIKKKTIKKETSEK